MRYWLTIILIRGAMAACFVLPAAMYVCLCNGITDRAVREAASAGARDLADLTAMTGCASVCGSCGDLALQLLNEAHRERVLPLPLLAA